MTFRLLGPLTVSGAPAPGGPRARALLALLLLDAGRTVTAERLVDGLYGDEPPAGAANALQSQVSRLRRALPDGVKVEHSPAGYRLTGAGADGVDALRFERLAREGARAGAAGDPVRAEGLLREALALWRGPALADVREAPYAAGQAARLDALRLDTLEEWAAALLAAGGDPAPLVPELARAAAAHPLRERLRALQMRALAGAGRQAEALAVYEEVRGALAEELGADPAAELTAAHLAVLRGEEPGAARAAGASRLPVPLTDFVGREREREQLRALLASARLSTLVGPGGAGKTRLAVEAVGDGGTGAGVGGEAVFVDLAAVGPGEVVAAFARALGVRDASPYGLVRALADRPLLLVVDNCEHVVAEAAGLVRELLAGCPGLRVLATSREALGITGESLLPVGALAPGAAAELFVRRGAAARPGFAGHARVPEICAALDALPLALELAAARLRTLTVDQIADRLGERLGEGFGEGFGERIGERSREKSPADSGTSARDEPRADSGAGPGEKSPAGSGTGPREKPRAGAGAGPGEESRTRADDGSGERLAERFRLLSRGDRTAPERHRTLAAVVEWSWELLGAEERELAARFSVFRGGATAEAVARVCGVEQADAEDVLASLAEKSLVEAGAFDTGTVRYRMLETVRAFAAGRLPTGDPAPAAHTAHHLALARAADPRLRGPAQLDWLARLDAEDANLRAALRRATAHAPADALRLVAALTPYWWLRGLRGQVAGLAAELLDAVDGAGIGPEAAGLGEEYVLCVLAAGAGAMGPHSERLDRARTLLTSRTEPLRQPFTAYLWATAAGPGERPEARLPLPDDPWTRALGLAGQGHLALGQGDVPAARAALTEALAGFRALGERWGTATALEGLAGLSPDPLPLFAEALELFESLGVAEDIVDLLGRRAAVHEAAGDTGPAAADRARAAAVARRAGLPEPG
ncbi:BTAD domain-containing putative transcriptional regulator [Streptomyces sp. NPDC004267]|uniref:BTAD domain-containing putative transcriptional regulator n=1 Tax=Streptomyces sp. NPDC004267 TaxID=3364694 RepID=UPI00369654C6